MPRYLIVRRWNPEVEPDVVMREAKEAADRFQAVQWEHSHVGLDEGRVVSFCVYAAPTADALREHADAVGQHEIDELYEIGGDISPSDFPD